MKQLTLVAAIRAQLKTDRALLGKVLLVSGVSACMAAPMAMAAEPLMDDDGYEIEVPIATFREVTYTSNYEFGFGYLSDDAVKFGEYNSLDESGPVVIGNIDLLQREAYDGDDHARYLKFSAKNLGTESREAELEYGRQGDYRIKLSVDQTEKQYSHSFVTPYDLTDPTDLKLPTPTYRVGDVDAADFLKSNSLGVRRDSWAVAYQKAFSKGWTASADVSRELKRGSKDYGFYAGSPQIIPEPIDYRTSQVTLGVEHATSKSQYQIKYYLSQFENEKSVLNLESAGNGSDNAMQLPPDNAFHQLSLNGNYRFTNRTRGTVYTSYSRGTQDEELLTLSKGVVNSTIDDGDPATPDGSFAPTSVDITRDTLIMQLGLSSQLSRGVSLSGKYRYEEKDVELQDVAYAWTILDLPFQRGVAQTLEMDSEKHRFNLDSAIRLPMMAKLKLGYEFEQIERSSVDQEETEEHTLKAKLKLPTVAGLMSSIDIARSNRDGQAVYDPNASKNIIHVGGPDSPNQNAAGSQKYNLADRERDQLGVNLSYAITSQVQVGASARMTADDYNKAVYGLQSSDQDAYSLDLSYAPSQSYSMHLYYGLQDLGYRQASARKGVDWFLDTEDQSHLIGTDVKFSVIPNRLDMTVGYRYTQSVAEIHHSVSSGTTPTPLPDLETEIHTFEVMGEYHLDAHSSVKAQYLYENYDSANWATDNIGPLGTSSTTYLAAGLESPNHELHYVGLTYKRAF